MEVYLLYHVYEEDDNEEVKFIGVFSTEEKANQVIDDLIVQPGFRAFPRACFLVDKTLIDRVGWGEGFIWDDAVTWPFKDIE